MFDLILKNITQRKLRTGLTVFGIALGIFAVIVMGGMSEHFNLTFDRSISLTADKIRVLPEGGLFGASLNESKVRDVKRVPGVLDAYGVLQAPLDPENIAFFGGNVILGIPPEKQQLTMKDTGLSQGRFLTAGDNYRAVIGSSVAREFNLNAGDELEIKSKRVQRTASVTRARNFTVVGIMEYTGSFFDNSVLIPLSTAQRFYGRTGTVSFIFAVPDSSTDTEDLAKRIELNVERVTTFSPEELRRQIEQSLIIFSLITISAAVLAAIIGGLSVMNTMLMSVSERTKEFGLMKALGAETKDILFITVGEAALMGILGGIIGIIGGGAFVYYLNDYLASRGTVLFTITPRLIMIAIVFAILLGILSGTYPAYRAAKMSPMEALRYE
ncbi:ABC-type transport system, involved in lipoprotein release, permease component [Candidatus Methanoperedens nitroreducens]|uniref:ABC-type transport system, involved in lipoprotein release, permease component n=1 Tax=Candidatus Methanoperedens nitratireducens TaxID=1392998 RepID=A0A062V0V2_9EURY|nr:ABC transporter permease [Candidatus Methanoperedens nitroreducens]KCZ72776.1 ABC-type transport system, involved in lipoprotein release, permease component [Candidatus Methanoperedens nitroreducens]MDJ1423294.1 ABC transporter permease [Candidatus Methanoperedens sp.]